MLENVRRGLLWFLAGLDTVWFSRFIWLNPSPVDVPLPAGILAVMLIIEWWSRQDAVIQARRDREEWEKLIWQ